MANSVSGVKSGFGRELWGRSSVYKLSFDCSFAFENRYYPYLYGHEAPFNRLCHAL